MELSDDRRHPPGPDLLGNNEGARTLGSSIGTALRAHNEKNEKQD
jgi:hypothetical protein